MKRFQAYKFELNIKPGQAHALLRVAGCCRFVYNRALAEQKARYEKGDKRLGYAGLCKTLTQWRQDPGTAFLAEAPTHPLQQTLKNLVRAYTNFFEGRTAFPRFHKRGRRDSFRYPDPKQFKLDQTTNRVYLPKIGWVRYRNSRKVEGAPKNITVAHECGRWFVSIQTERTVPTPVPLSTSAVGIDLGVTRFATLSDGAVYMPLNAYRGREKQLAWEQRKLSRMKKFSNNWKKQRNRIATICRQIANARKDTLHKVSTTISQNHAMVVVEDLKVGLMSASARGTLENPGTHVRSKAGMNKAILDQGWSSFRRMLEYKLSWNGGWLVAVYPANTSRTCSVCGDVSAANRTTQARFCCIACGHEENADLNAARNILRAGHARFACSEPQGFESQAQGSKAHRGLMAGTNPAGAMPGISVL